MKNPFNLIALIALIKELISIKKWMADTYVTNNISLNYVKF